jgi:hypothetical protein
VNERKADVSAEVAVIDGESGGFEDDMLDAETDRINVEGDDFFDEYVLEELANGGLLAEAAEEEEVAEG